MGKITFVTGNANKLKEVNAMLGADVLESRKIDLEEIQGTSEEVSKHKARAAAEIIGGPIIVEDTGLEFDAMGGLPGPYIKWFLENLGVDGLPKMLAGFEDKGAKATCTFAYCEGPGQEPVLFRGEHCGQIVAPSGPRKFGWNPIFLPENSDKTYAEMSDEEKNSCSHRYRAICKLREFLADKK